MGTVSTADALWGSFDEYDAKNEKYKSSVYINANQMYPVLPQQLQQDSLNNWQNRITQYVYADNSADYIVDNIIRVRAPSVAFRQTRIDHWEAAKTTLKNVTWLGAASTLLSGAGIFLAASNPVGLTACIVATTASLIFTCIGLSKISQANQQIDLWNTKPEQRVAELRSAAYKYGFSYVCEHKLKIEVQPSAKGVLHPTEVQYLYESYFPNFCSKLLNRNLDAKSQWMLDFLHYNPLSSNLITYALGHIPQKLHYVSHDFAQLQTILSNIQTHFAGIKQEVRDSASKVIDAYNAKRSAALLPLILARDHYTATARAQLERDLKGVTDPNERRSLKKICEAEEEKYELFYQLAAAPINIYFDNQIQQTRIQRDNSIREITINEQQNLAIYYPAARDLIQRAYNVWTQPTVVYVPVNFAQYAYQPQQPSAPSFDNLPNFQEQVYRQRAPQEWGANQQSEYQAYLNYLRQTQGRS